MYLKLKHQQPKTIMYIYRLLYQYLMITAKQKSIIDIHTEKKKESKYNTNGSHQITREEKKKGGKKEDPQKQVQNN